MTLAEQAVAASSVDTVPVAMTDMQGRPQAVIGRIVLPAIPFAATDLDGVDEGGGTALTILDLDDGLGVASAEPVKL